jgi:glutaredoxin
MVTSQKICVHSLKAKDLLKRNGYRVDDHHLKDPDAIQTFNKAHNVPSLPQVFIENKAIGGFDELRKHSAVTSNAENSTTYKPIIALFLIAGFLALNTLWLGNADKSLIRFLELFVSISMVLLGLQKLQDIERFANMFLNYDLLA